MEHETNHLQSSMNALLPREMAEKAEQVGMDKARLDYVCLMVLAVLAGAFIAFGAIAASVAAAGADGVIPYGLKRLISGAVFSLGLILVIVGGAELFTGNNLMVMAWASGKIKLRELLRAWTLVYFGNFAGASATAVFVFLAGLHQQGDGAVGAAVLASATAKAALSFPKALLLGMLGNTLVCLAVWLCYSARSTTDRILAIVPPVTVFVAAGFEHSVANMFVLPFALLIKWGAPQSFWTSIHQTPAGFDALRLDVLLTNLVPVTIGNVIGGGVMVGAVYWFVYLRKRHGQSSINEL